MRSTIKDVARVAQVSIATASMAVNNKPGIKSETKNRVLEVAKELNYTPNHSARSLSTQKSNTIGLVVTDITNPFFGMLVNEINNCVLKKEYKLLLGVSNDIMENEVSCIQKFTQDGVEGVIVVPTIQNEYDLTHLYDLNKNAVPFVFATTYYQGIAADCIMTDLKKGSYLLTNKLLKSGHKKIFLFSGNRQAMFSAARIEGYKEAFQEANVVYSEDWIIEVAPNFDGGYEATQDVLNQKPDAITTVNDVMAMGVLKCLKDNQIKVPLDISVAGYDDLMFTSILETALTTIRQPIADIAKKTVEVLFDKINHPSKNMKTYYVEPILKIRETTR